MAPYECSLTLSLPSMRAAAMIARSLSVDEELQPDKVERRFTCSSLEGGAGEGAGSGGAQLEAFFRASDARMLRVSLSSFYDMAAVCLRTLQEFDDGA